MFTRLAEPLHRELHAHCYRMLGCAHDADDALQEALLRAWRGLARFEGAPGQPPARRIAAEITDRDVETAREPPFGAAKAASMFIN